jgi:hypothetical protein
MSTQEAIEKLKEVAIQLDRWANESKSGGWSTHQVEPMRKKADELWAFIGRAKK